MQAAAPRRARGFWPCARTAAAGELPGVGEGKGGEVGGWFLGAGRAELFEGFSSGEPVFWVCRSWAKMVASRRSTPSRVFAPSVAMRGGCEGWTDGECPLENSRSVRT